MLLALLTAMSPPQSKQSTLRKRRMSVEQAAAAQEEGETIRCAHAKHFNASFWLICTTHYCIALPIMYQAALPHFSDSDMLR